MIVITLTKVPNALRGDLTKWYQEIQTGVYVGSVSARIRDSLWLRIVKNIGRGEATMVYNANNELGYQFKTTRRDHQVVDYDGIPLMMHLNAVPQAEEHGYSDAAKFHKARVMSQKAQQKRSQPSRKNNKPMVAVDLETTGLDPSKDVIISIGAVKATTDGQASEFSRLISVTESIPQKISTLTGLTNDMLAKQGVPIVEALSGLNTFIGDCAIVGYNFHFDEAFLKQAFISNNLEALRSQTIDLMPIVKRTNAFLDNYRLATVLSVYEIENLKLHHALEDARATLALAQALNKLERLKI